MADTVSLPVCTRTVVRSKERRRAQMFESFRYSVFGARNRLHREGFVLAMTTISLS